MPAKSVQPRLHFPCDMPASAHAAIEAYFEYAQIGCCRLHEATSWAAWIALQRA